MDIQTCMLAGSFFLIALLYSSVGHAGATGYLAVMALAGIQPTLMKPTALACNILVASIAFYKYSKKNAISFQLLIPLIAVSVPCAYIGGLINLPASYYKTLVGIFLLFAAHRVFFTAQGNTNDQHQSVSWPILCATGALLGFISGLTGVGGGVFLSPIMLLFRWAPIRTISGVAAGFILLNSIAGLAGWFSSCGHMSCAQTPHGLAWFVLAVVFGGMMGAEFGSHRLSTSTIQKLLAVTLLFAGIKLLLSVDWVVNAITF